MLATLRADIDAAVTTDDRQCAITMAARLGLLSQLPDDWKANGALMDSHETAMEHWRSSMRLWRDEVGTQLIGEDTHA